MKICTACGERNFSRPSIRQDWRCENCNALIEPAIKGSESITSGSKLTPRRLQHDEYPWEHENA